MTKLPGLLATAAILAGTAVAGANAQETIKIGVTQPLTGAFAASGNYVAQGAKIAEDEINKAGGVLGKMISPQNIATGAAMTNMQGREGDVLARTFKHSLILTFLLGLLVMAEQYLVPGIIPAVAAHRPF